MSLFYFTKYFEDFGEKLTGLFANRNCYYSTQWSTTELVAFNKQPPRVISYNNAKDLCSSIPHLPSQSLSTSGFHLHHVPSMTNVREIELANAVN